MRASGQRSLNGFFSYSLSFGGRVALPPGIMVNSGSGGLSATQMAAPVVGRYRLSFNAQVQNLTNRGNLSGYSGNMLSQFFGKPTTVLGTRKVDFGLGLSCGIVRYPL